jgi:hypothetical protein
MYKKTLSTLRLIFVTCTAVAVHQTHAQNAIYDLPNVEGLANLSASELASQLRDLNHSFIEVLSYIRQGRLTPTLRDNGRVHEVIAKNANRWELEFQRRHAVLSLAARARGYRDVSGIYSVRMEPANCVLTTPAPTEAIIGQYGPELVVYFSVHIKFSGTVVLDSVDLPLYGRAYLKPHFAGSATAGSIQITNGEGCQVEFTKRSAAK